jgi:hypothetical protein
MRIFNKNFHVCEHCELVVKVLINVVKKKICKSLNEFGSTLYTCSPTLILTQFSRRLKVCKQKIPLILISTMKSEIKTCIRAAREYPSTGGPRRLQ